MELLHEVITAITEKCDLRILPAFWNLTLTFSKNGANLREGIKKKIPDMIRLYGLQNVWTSSFPILVKFWKTELVLRETTVPKEALLEFARSNNKISVYYIVRRIPLGELDYQGIIEQLVIEDNLPLMIFLFKKVSAVLRLDPILEVAQKHGRTNILKYFNDLLIKVRTADISNGLSTASRKSR